MSRAEVRRICVVRMGGMGDILLATPSVRALSTHFDTTDIDFIVGKGMAPALDGIPYLRRVIEWDKNGDDARPANMLHFFQSLRREKYDLFVNFHPSLKTFLMAAFSHAPRVITFTKDQRIQKQTGRIRHAVEDFAKELAPLGIGLPCPNERYLDWHTPPQARLRVAQILHEHGVSRDKLVLVNPAASHEVNRWPASRIAAFLNAASHELGSDVRVGLVGGPQDKDLASEILTQTESDVRAGIINLAGQLSVKELGAVLERADVLVTGDTGPMHIASAVGTPIVALFGPADPDRTGPVGPKGRDLVVVNRDGLTCVPCRKRFCRRGDTACMTHLPVLRVLEAVRRQIEPATGGKRGIK